jgi:hypothetical protein
MSGGGRASLGLTELWLLPLRRVAVTVMPPVDAGTAAVGAAAAGAAAAGIAGLAMNIILATPLAAVNRRRVASTEILCTMIPYLHFYSFLLDFGF